MITELSKKANELLEKETWEREDFYEIERVLELLWERWNESSKKVDDFVGKIKEINATRHIILPEKLYEELLCTPRTFSLKKYENYLRPFEDTTRTQLQNEFSFLHSLLLLLRENILPNGDLIKKAFEQTNELYTTEIDSLEHRVEVYKENEDKFKKTRFFKMLPKMIEEMEDVLHLINEEEEPMQQQPEEPENNIENDKETEKEPQNEEKPLENREKIKKLLSTQTNLTADEMCTILKIDIKTIRPLLTRMVGKGEIEGKREFGKKIKYCLK